MAQRASDESVWPRFEYPDPYSARRTQPIPLKVVHPSVYATPPAVPAGVAPGKVGGAVADARRAR